MIYHHFYAQKAKKLEKMPILVFKKDGVKLFPKEFAGLPGGLLESSSDVRETIKLRRNDFSKVVIDYSRKTAREIIDFHLFAHLSIAYDPNNNEFTSRKNFIKDLEENRLKLKEPAISTISSIIKETGGWVGADFFVEAYDLYCNKFWMTPDEPTKDLFFCIKTNTLQDFSARYQ